MREYKEQLNNPNAGHSSARQVEPAAIIATASQENNIVARVASEQESPTVPVPKHSFNLDQLPQGQQSEAPADPPPQHYLPPSLPQSSVEAPQLNLETVANAPPSHSLQNQGNIDLEAHEDTHSQPTPHQFMGWLYRTHNLRILGIRWIGVHWILGSDWFDWTYLDLVITEQSNCTGGRCLPDFWSFLVEIVLRQFLFEVYHRVQRVSAVEECNFQCSTWWNFWQTWSCLLFGLEIQSVSCTSCELSMLD